MKVRLVIMRDGIRHEGVYDFPVVPRVEEVIHGNADMGFALARVSEVTYDLNRPGEVTLLLR